MIGKSKILFYTAMPFSDFVKVAHQLILHVLFEFQIKDKFALKDEAKHKEPLAYFWGTKLNFNAMVYILFETASQLYLK